MAQILVRNLEPEVVDRLKKRAQSHGRSLQAEVAEILREESQKMTMAEARAAAEEIQRRFAGRTFPDSAELIREDRER
ncbi:MAG: FitA-like ribbon-helix-helix domain-containing protein [Dehalococcoidia bacterium]